MIRCVAVSVHRLRRAVVEADVVIVARKAAGVAVDELDARSRGRLQGEANVAAPAVGSEHAQIDVADDIACPDRKIADER